MPSPSRATDTVSGLVSMSISPHRGSATLELARAGVSPPQEREDLSILPMRIRVKWKAAPSRNTSPLALILLSRSATPPGRQESLQNSRAAFCSQARRRAGGARPRYSSGVHGCRSEEHTSELQSPMYL